jgi:hypothetical protein
VSSSANNSIILIVDVLKAVAMDGLVTQSVDLASTSLNAKLV